MKIDSLVKNLEKNTAEQDKAMQKQAQSVTKQHLASYEQLLRSSRNETEQALAENIKLIRESKSTIQQALTYKTLIGALMGGLIAIALILLTLNLWLGISLKNNRAELAEIQQNIEQTPVQAQVLAKVNIGKNDDGTLWIEAKQKKKAEVGKSTNGKPLMMLE